MHFRNADTGWVVGDSATILRTVADGQPLLVVFACNHCPYVRWLEQDLGRMIATTGIHAVAINTNDTEQYPEDGPEGMREQITRAGWGFPYLIDAELMVRWMGEWAELQPKAGGRLAIDINGVPIRGDYVVVEPPHRRSELLGHQLRE